MGRKRKLQGKPQEMSLQEFNKQAPVDLSIPKVGSIGDPQWDKVDLNMGKDSKKPA